jgi:hypothetical protein
VLWLACTEGRKKEFDNDDDDEGVTRMAKRRRMITMFLVSSKVMMVSWFMKGRVSTPRCSFELFISVRGRMRRALATVFPRGSHTSCEELLGGNGAGQSNVPFKQE